MEIISPFAGFTIIVVAQQEPAGQTLKELIDHAKANPDKLNYGSVGIGSSQHLAGEYFAASNGREDHPRALSQHRAIWPRPDRGSSCRSASNGSRTSPAPIGAKGAIPLAVAATSAVAALPDVPTTTEAGLPEYKVNGWFAMAAPKGTPKPILEKLNKEMTEALTDPAVRQAFERAAPRRWRCRSIRPRNSRR